MNGWFIGAKSDELKVAQNNMFKLRGRNMKQEHRSEIIYNLNFFVAKYIYKQTHSTVPFGSCNTLQDWESAGVGLHYLNLSSQVEIILIYK